MTPAEPESEDPRGDEQLGERERWDKERYLAEANEYISTHPDEWDDLLDDVDADWREHYRSRWRAMCDYRDTVALNVAHLLEVGELE